MDVDRNPLPRHQIYPNQVLIPYYLENRDINEYEIIPYLFSLIYELDVCNVGDPFVLEVCRDTERIKLSNKMNIY